ncbi:MAG: hypothetical protein ACJA08_000546 [Cyclobacteriaceae bacterium]|jgi:hypothetical protein
MLLGGSILINACQEQESAQPQLEEVKYEMYDDEFVTVVLDPNYMSVSHHFQSIEEYDNYLNLMEESGVKVIVNKTKYQDLIHYFDPFEISVMDEENQVSIGDVIYKATSEATYKREIDKDAWELDIFYGLDGKADLKETELIYKNIANLDALQDYQFKSPASRKIYIGILEDVKTNGRILNTKTTDYYDWKTSPTGAKYLVQARDEYAGDVKYFLVRWNCWHETFHEGLYDRAKGGTITEWQATDMYSNHCITSGCYTAIPSGTKFGTHHLNNITDTSVPSVKVEVLTCKGTRTAVASDWSVASDRIRRCSNGWAHSYHYSNVRENDSNISTSQMNGFYID